jgi:hypothetical protein
MAAAHRDTLPPAAPLVMAVEAHTGVGALMVVVGARPTLAQPGVARIAAPVVTERGPTL